MLDIGIIIPELCKHGGAERYLIECLMRWQHEHRLTVYATVFSEALFAEAGLTKVATRLLTPRFEGQHSALLNATLLPKIWEAEIGRHDIYHSHLWPTHLLDLHPLVWFPHEPLRLLYDLRYSQVEDELVDGLEKMLHFYPKETYDSVEGKEYNALLRTIEAFDKVGHPDRVVGNSRYTANYLRQVYGFEVNDYVYPGVTVEDMLTLPGSRDIVLTIGQLWPHKRMRIIIEAISQVEAVQLYIVGSGPEKESLEKIAQRMGVADRVFFLHGLDNHEVQILLARCLCVVLTSAREPFGIVALEALAASKPLIAVNEGGYTEVVDDQCAILVPPQPAVIAGHLRRLQADPALVEQMGRHGRVVAARHSWDRTARELLAIIEDTHAQWVCEHAAPAPAAGPLFAAHYFLWYKEGFGNAHWCDNPASGWVSDASELGYYSSMNGDTIASHLAHLESIKMDVVLFNIHVNERGLEVYELHAAERMQEMARQRKSPLRFAVNLCLYTREPELIESAVSILRSGIMARDNYLQLGGRPAFMIFWSGAFDGDIRLIEQLRRLTAETLRIGVFTRPHKPGSEARKTFGLFEAISQLSPLELGAPASWEDVWQNEYDASAATSGYHCATLCPGYDDTQLSDPVRAAGVRKIPSEGGKTYRRTMDFALKQDSPTLILVNSFNEFHENTHIEPALRAGQQYLDMTGAFITEARARWGISAPPEDTTHGGEAMDSRRKEDSKNEGE